MTREDAPFRAALVQMDPAILDTDRNRAAIIDGIRIAAEDAAKLVVLPECALGGYVYESAADAMPAAESRSGKTVDCVVDSCREFGVHAVFGFIERDDTDGSLYNSAAVCGPEGLAAVYRKCHLPVLGIDRFVARGNSLPVYDLGFVRIGILICYDIRFPEAPRSLALRGADVLVVPTNWPQGADSAPDFLTRARAWENRVYVLACNRVGVERGVTFIGRSQIVSPGGEILAEGPGDVPTIVCADIYPTQSRQKRIVIAPGEFELDPIGGRRPELYTDICAAGVS